MAEAATLQKSAQGAATQHFDVIIVGAGISGIGGAYHLKTQRPGTRYCVLEALDSFGGTWLTHTYPGIRSDSDLYTFGYRFKPWVGPPIATAAEILSYMGEVIDENGLGEHIRYRRRISAARLVVARQALDTGGDPAPTASRPTRPTSSGCARATIAIRSATLPTGRTWTSSRAGSSIRRPGRRTLI